MSPHCFNGGLNPNLLASFAQPNRSMNRVRPSYRMYMFIVCFTWSHRENVKCILSLPQGGKTQLKQMEANDTIYIYSIFEYIILYTQTQLSTKDTHIEP